MTEILKHPRHAVAMPCADGDTEQSKRLWDPAAPHPPCVHSGRVDRCPKEAPPRVTAALLLKTKTANDSSPRAGRMTRSRGIASSREEDSLQGRADGVSGVGVRGRRRRPDVRRRAGQHWGPHPARLMMRTDAGATRGLVLGSWLFNGHSVKFSRAHGLWTLA